MAKVERFKEKKGQMFGGKGVAVWRPLRNKQSPSETAGLIPEEQLATEAESALVRKISANQPQSTEPVKDAVSAIGVHFSQQPRNVLDSSFFGSGLRGLENKRLADASDLRQRV